MSDLVKRPVLGRSLRRDPRREEKRVEYLAFSLAGETYAVRIEDVAEILKPPPVTPVPRAPDLVLGIMSVRGRLVTVIDVRRRFGHPESTLGRRNRILLTDVDGETTGALVDEVQQVHRLSEGEIEPPAVLGADQQTHIVGIGRPIGSERGDVLVLLDLREILRSR
jgi:purine-binding chemotaxis protein CheW